MIKWGVITYTDGKVYKGYMEDNLPTIKGTLTCPDGTVYKGGFDEGEFDRKGFIKFPNGMTYKGEFSAGTSSGLGIIKYANGSVYKGEVEEYKPHGKGIMTLKTNSKVQYIGTWENGEFIEGEKHTKKVIYIGKFSSLKPVGKCFMKTIKNGWAEGYFNGEKFEGPWIVGIKNQTIFEGDYDGGPSKEYYPNGILRYEGQSKNRKREGYGKFYDKHGNLIYEGEFKQDKKHGHGKEYNKNGTLIFEGEFADDKRI